MTCFSCGEEMLPWWQSEVPTPHSDDPPRQWHLLCFNRWLAYMVAWRRYGGGFNVPLLPPLAPAIHSLAREVALGRAP